MTEERLHVVIVSHRAGWLLERTLRCVRDALERVENVEVLLLLNGPVNRAPEIAADLERQRLLVCVRVDSPIKTVALNLAVNRIGRGPILFLDDDVCFPSDLFAVYQEVFRHHGSGNYFGGMTTCEYQHPPSPWLVRFLPASARGLAMSGDKIPTRFYGFLGFNWAAYVEDIVLAGGFRETIGPGTAIPAGDESEMQIAMVRLGHSPVYVGSALVTHYVPVSRCNVRWVLGRHYYGSYIAGMRARDVTHSYRQIGSLVRKFRQNALAYFDRSMVLAFLMLRREGIFFVASLLVRLLGFSRGFCRPAELSPKRGRSPDQLPGC